MSALFVAGSTALSRKLAQVLQAGTRLLQVTLLVLVATAASAQADPPNRVARVSALEGEAWFVAGSPEGERGERERSRDWDRLVRNYPLTTADNLWVPGGSRMELDYGAGQLRMTRDANAFIRVLDDRTAMFYAAGGTFIWRQRYLEPGEQAIFETSNTRIELRQPALIRVEVSSERGATTVMVREGVADVATGNIIQTLRDGESLTIGGGYSSHYSFSESGRWDSFDGWSEARDRRYASNRSHSYVPRQMIGWSELDEYGRWETSTTYGTVWYPSNVSDGWAPYRYGRWVWVSPWGWTWVDDAPWGFAPSHYGRWVLISGRWGWCPGAWDVRPVYAPALVYFFGGSGWSVSIGAPLYGWVPLGWRDVYWPWYRTSHRYYERVNKPYVPHVPAKPPAPVPVSNIHVAGASTIVTGAIFTGGKPIAENVVNVKPTVVSGAPALSSDQLLAKPVVSGAMAQSLPKPSVPPPVPAAVIAQKPRVGGENPGYSRPLPPGVVGGSPADGQLAKPTVVPGGSSGSTMPGGTVSGGYRPGEGTAAPKPMPMPVEPPRTVVGGAPVGGGDSYQAKPMPEPMAAPKPVPHYEPPPQRVVGGSPSTGGETTMRPKPMPEPIYTPPPAPVPVPMPKPTYSPPAPTPMPSYTPPPAPAPAPMPKPAPMPSYAPPPVHAPAPMPAPTVVPVRPSPMPGPSMHGAPSVGGAPSMAPAPVVPATPSRQSIERAQESGGGKIGR